MKIDKIYSRMQRNGECWIIARVKAGNKYTTRQIRLTPERFRTVREGDVL